jgi:hypothetical protein
MLMRRLVIFLSAAAAIASCKDDKPPAGPLSLDDFRDRLIAGFCRLDVACEGSPDMATCLASLQEQPGYYATIRQDIASGRVSYDAEKAGRCIEVIEQVLSCRRSETAPLAVQFDDEFGEFCSKVFTGTVAAGGSCFLGAECVGDGYCSRTDPACSISRQCCAGTCVAATPSIPVGGDCSAPTGNQSCARGSFCVSGPSGGRTCTLPSTVEGSACTSQLCAAPLFCDVGPNGTGTCKHRVSTGEACNPTSDGCDDQRDSCDPTTLVCTRKARVGETCDTARYNCVGYATCQGTTCIKRPTAGEACPSTGPTCLGGLYCDTQTATCTLSPVGGACS